MGNRNMRRSVNNFRILQDDLLQSVFVVRETLVELESENHFLH